LSRFKARLSAVIFWYLILQTGTSTVLGLLLCCSGSLETVDSIEITDSQHRNLLAYNGGFVLIDQQLMVPIEISDASSSSVPGWIGPLGCLALRTEKLDIVLLGFSAVSRDHGGFNIQSGQNLSRSMTLIFYNN
jgi:hypothetical protein